MSKKIWAICSGSSWYDANVEYLILPDEMDLRQERIEQERALRKHHLDRRQGKKSKCPETLFEWLINKGAVVPTDNVLEEFWSD